MFKTYDSQNKLYVTDWNAFLFKIVYQHVQSHNALPKCSLEAKQNIENKAIF